MKDVLKTMRKEVRLISKEIEKVRYKSTPQFSALYNIKRQLLSIESSLNTSPKSSLPEAPQWSIKETPKPRKPVKDLLQDEYLSKVFKNPRSPWGMKTLKNRYNLNENTPKRNRSIGFKAWKKPNLKKTHNLKVIPCHIRNDPPTISEKEVEEGVFSLINRGLIPKATDLSPAFERGKHPLQLKPIDLQNKVINTNRVKQDTSTIEIVLKYGQVTENSEFKAFKNRLEENHDSFVDALNYASFSLKSVDYCVLDGNLVLKYSHSFGFGLLMDCVINKDYVKQELIKERNQAAAKIQKYWRDRRRLL